jgi:hypothetical protein
MLSTLPVFPLLADVRRSHCHPTAASSKLLFINHLIDIIQRIFYNRQRAAGEPRETESTHIHQNPAYQ